MSDSSDNADFLNEAADSTRISENELHELLGQYVTALDSAKRNVEEAERELAVRKGLLRTLQEEQLPRILADAHLSGVTLEDGRKLTVKEEVYVQMPKKDQEQRDVCFKWLEEKGMGDLIKDEVKLVESETTKIDADLLDKLTSLGLYYERNRDVNTNTLKATFKALLGISKGTVQTVSLDEIPAEFGVYKVSVADIK